MGRVRVVNVKERPGSWTPTYIEIAENIRTRNFNPIAVQQWLAANPNRTLDDLQAALKASRVDPRGFMPVRPARLSGGPEGVYPEDQGKRVLNQVEGPSVGGGAGTPEPITHTVPGLTTG